MKKMQHYVCEVYDTINKGGPIWNRYHDTTTTKKAEDHFKKMPEFKRYMRPGYKIIMRVNDVMIWED